METLTPTAGRFVETFGLALLVVSANLLVPRSAAFYYKAAVLPAGYYALVHS